jgi:choline dehydrogenase-like flavoprotein
MIETSRSYDYVIVGAGSAGCLLANRLSDAGAHVVVLEAGGSDRRPEVKAPAAFPNQFQTTLDWNYMSEPEPGLYGRRLFLPRGKMVGGSSSMNAMLYARGNRSDYDRWESELGPPGEGVVDPSLRVHGIEGLRVADASVMPRITSGNTNAPTYMIAERCAALMTGGE